MAAQNPYWPLSSWQANFTAGVNDPEPSAWDDLTDRTAQGYTVELGKQFELDAAESGEANVKCRDVDEALNPANPSSPWNSGGKALVPYRRIRHWAAWPLAGNLLNSANNVWAGARSTGSLADTATCEGGTTGTWTATTGCVLAADTAHVHSGGKALRVTWATTSGGAGNAALAAVSVPLKGSTVYTASMWVFLGTGAPAVTLACQGGTATSTTTTGAWQRVTLTWTADNTTTDLRVYAAGATTSGQQMWIDDVQVEAASSASTFTTSGPTIYPLFGGYIERYPLSWTDHGLQGWTDLTAVDALALLSRVQLQACAVQDAMQDAPAFLWPLDDAQGSVVAANLGTAATRAGQMWLAPMGSPASQSTTFGGASDFGVDQAGSVAFAPTVPSSTYAPLVDWNGHSAYTVGGTTGATFEVWFQSTVAQQMRILRVWGAAQEEYAVVLDAAGHVTLEHHSLAGSTDGSTTSLGSYSDGAWHHVAVVASWSSGVSTEALWVDGQKIGTIGRSAASTMVAQGAMLGYDYWAGSHAFTGSMAQLAVYPTPLPDARVTSHWLAARTGFAGDTTDQRISRLLAWASWGGRTVLPSGASRHGPLTGLGGGSASVLSVAKVAEVTERGTFYAAQDGRLTLVSRGAYYAQTSPRATFGEDAAGGESPYTDGAAELDPTYVYNQITVTRGGGSAQVAIDVTSQGAYGARSVSTSTSHATDGDAASLGAYLLTQYPAARLRVSELTLNAAANPALWPVVLGTRFGDRVTWKRRTRAGVTVVLDGFVERIAHDVGPGKWDAKLMVSPVDTYQAGLIGDATYGLIGSTLISTY